MSLDRQGLINAARDLVHRASQTTAGLWPRASALLARQALETTLADLWRVRAPGLEDCSARAQLLCLPFYLVGAEELGRRVAYAWAGLSRACHQHAYELSPASSELLAWISTVEQFAAQVGSIEAAAIGRHS